VQAVLERRCVPLNMSGVRGGVFEGKTMRTMPISICRPRLTPESSELIINTVKCGLSAKLDFFAATYLDLPSPSKGGDIDMWKILPHKRQYIVGSSQKDS
jgi:hypothetical protein